MGDSEMDRESYNVLLVDDSEDDRFFIRRALQKSRLAIIWEAQNGDEALAYLTGQQKFKDRNRYPLPDILMVDLKMPGKTGYDLLEWLKTQTLPEMMIVILSGSFLPEDIARCLALGAHAYYKKTSDKEEQLVMLRKIEETLAQRNKAS